MIVEKFMTWAESAPADRRAAAAGALSRAYHSNELDDNQCEAIESALTVLLEDQLGLALKQDFAVGERLLVDAQRDPRVSA